MLFIGSCTPSLLSIETCPVWPVGGSCRCCRHLYDLDISSWYTKGYTTVSSWQNMCSYYSLLIYNLILGCNIRMANYPKICSETNICFLFIICTNNPRNKPLFDSQKSTFWEMKWQFTYYVGIIDYLCLLAGGVWHCQGRGNRLFIPFILVVLLISGEVFIYRCLPQNNISITYSEWWCPVWIMSS